MGLKSYSVKANLREDANDFYSPGLLGTTSSEGQPSFEGEPRSPKKLLGCPQAGLREGPPHLRVSSFKFAISHLFFSLRSRSNLQAANGHTGVKSEGTICCLSVHATRGPGN